MARLTGVGGELTGRGLTIGGVAGGEHGGSAFPGGADDPVPAPTLGEHACGRVPDPAGYLGTASGWSIGFEMICLQSADVSDLAQLRQPFVGRAGGDPHADPGQCDAVPGGA